jgi:hypothetical protein
MFKKQFVRAVRVLLRGRGLEHERLVFEFFCCKSVYGIVAEDFRPIFIDQRRMEPRVALNIVFELGLAFVNI